MKVKLKNKRHIKRTDSDLLYASDFSYKGTPFYIVLPLPIIGNYLIVFKKYLGKTQHFLTLLLVLHPSKYNRPEP